jgi:hypothetical protein
MQHLCGGFRDNAPLLTNVFAISLDRRLGAKASTDSEAETTRGSVCRFVFLSFSSQINYGIIFFHLPDGGVQVLNS